MHGCPIHQCNSTPSSPTYPYFAPGLSSKTTSSLPPAEATNVTLPYLPIHLPPFRPCLGPKTTQTSLSKPKNATFPSPSPRFVCCPLPQLVSNLESPSINDQKQAAIEICFLAIYRSENWLGKSSMFVPSSCCGDVVEFWGRMVGIVVVERPSGTRFVVLWRVAARVRGKGEKVVAGVVQFRGGGFWWWW